MRALHQTRDNTPRMQRQRAAAQPGARRQASDSHKTRSVTRTNESRSFTGRRAGTTKVLCNMPEFGFTMCVPACACAAAHYNYDHEIIWPWPDIDPDPDVESARPVPAAARAPAAVY